MRSQRCKAAAEGADQRESLSREDLVDRAEDLAVREDFLVVLVDLVGETDPVTCPTPLKWPN